MSAGSVLIAEDEKELREVLAKYLTDAGYTVLQAETGTHGLDIALEQRPSLLLIDIRMPEMSGYEMLRRIRAAGDWGAHVPAIFLTNIVPSSAEEKSDVEATEPAHYLVKSDVALEEVVKKVRAILEK